MAPQSDRVDLVAAWRALDVEEREAGWRTIAVKPAGPFRLLAGRHFPGGEETLLVGFGLPEMPKGPQLPQGAGFLVTVAELPHEDSRRYWVALSRKSAGSLDLFTAMAVDVISSLEASLGTDDQVRFRNFLARIRAWQEFMRRGSDLLLSPEEEVGLFGEIEVFLSLLDCGLPESVVTDAWRGPLDGIHDFSLSTGAIEVKSTVAPVGFPATIGSLEQLDDSLVHPLYLAAARLALDSSGHTLANHVARARQALRGDPGAAESFERLLLHAGFFDAIGDQYVRQFVCAELRILRVSNPFPRLIRANVPIEIRRVHYEMDVDLANGEQVDLSTALSQLGI